MTAQILKDVSPIESRPLQLVDLPVPQPKAKEILVKISDCGVCHTQLDEIEGRLQPKLPVVLGHEIIGRGERSPDLVKAGEYPGIRSLEDGLVFSGFQVPHVPPTTLTGNHKGEFSLAG